MDLVSSADAIYLIKNAEPGSMLYLALYKNVKYEEEYKELKTLLNCGENIDIVDGKYKVYSSPDTTMSYATGWINAKIWEYYKNNPPMFADVLPAINGFTLWPDMYSTLDDYINEINANKNMHVNAIYDSNENKIVLTAKNPGEIGAVSLTIGDDDGWPNEYGERVSPGGKLQGIFEEGVPASHVKIVITPYINEDIKMDIVDDILITVKSDIDFTLDLTQYWKWDRYTEDENTAVIDWGDGTPIQIIDNENIITHPYFAGEYTLKINGLHWCGSKETTPVKMPITKIIFNKNQVIDNPVDVYNISDILESVDGKVYVSPVAGIEETEIKFV